MHSLQVTGDFMLIDPETRTVFDPGVPVDVDHITHFIHERVALGQLAHVGGDPLPEPTEAPVLPEPPVPGAPIEPVPVVVANDGKVVEAVDYTPVFPDLPPADPNPLLMVGANPLDHDGDGKPGGSLKGEESTVRKGKRKKGRK